MDHSYTMTQWQDAPSTETPLNAENLNHIEQGIGAIYHDVGALEESLKTFIVSDLLPTETHESGEGSYTSAHDYSADDLMIAGTKVYKALSAIAIGDTIILPDSGSTANVSEISLGEAIIKLASQGDGGGDSPDISGLVTRIDAVESSVSNIVQNDLPILRYRITALEDAAAPRSHIGQIIQSTTLDTMAKVINVYGGTTWIQHDGYMLLGASSNVTPNSAVADGGEETVTLTANQSGVRSHGHDVHVKRVNLSAETSGNTHVLVHTSNGGITNVSEDSSSGYIGYTSKSAANSHNNMPPYKNVYIWERTA